MNATKLAIATVASLLTATVLAVFLSWVETQHAINIYGFSAMFVIPIGAIGCGFVSAIGFWLVSRVLHIRPTGAARFFPLLTALATFGIANYLSYTWFKFPNGASPSDVMSFVEYLKLVSTEASYSIGSSGNDTTIDRVGSLGYALTALQIIGFAGGGFLLSSTLTKIPWCETSERFMKKTAKHQRFFGEEGLGDQSHLAFAAMQATDIESVRSIVTNEQDKVKPRKRCVSLLLTEHACTHCGRHRHSLSQTERNGNNWAVTASAEFDEAGSPTLATAPPTPAIVS